MASTEGVQFGKKKFRSQKASTAIQQTYGCRSQVWNTGFIFHKMVKLVWILPPVK